MSTVNIDWKYLTVARPRLRCEEDFYTKYRVSLKKVGLVFRARFEVFRVLRSKKFRRLRFYLLEHVFDQI